MQKKEVRKYAKGYESNKGAAQQKLSITEKSRTVHAYVNELPAHEAYTCS